MDEPGFRAAAIGELMERDSLSKAQFIRRSGFSRQLVGGWVSGLVQPRIDTIVRLCVKFGVDASFFCQGLPDQKQEKR